MTRILIVPRFAACVLLAWHTCGWASALALEPVPDRLVVLTFDDSVKSQFTVARPILKEFGFCATFYITEGFTFRTNKRDYMTWEEIRQLHQDGFEIGNHTRDHVAVVAKTLDQLHVQLAAIDVACDTHGIPKTTTFCWPGTPSAAKASRVCKPTGFGSPAVGAFPSTRARRGSALLMSLDETIRC